MRTPTRLTRAGLAVLAAATVAVVLTPGPASAAEKCGPTSTEKLTEEPWPLARLNPSAAWPISRGNGVVVAVIDAGVSNTVPVLAGKMRAGRDYVNLKSDGTCDLVGHGTIVASIIAGRDGTGPFSGIAPGALILPVRVIAKEEETNEDLSPRIADAVHWAADRAAVINISLSTNPSPKLASEIKYALDKGVVVVAAAGNQKGGAQQGPSYPAAYDGVVAVAGVDPDGKHVETSVSGSYVDIAAPGVDIIGPAPQGGGFVRRTGGGTSFAAAYVSGTAALVKSANPNMSNTDIVARMLATADRPADGYTQNLGWGVVNPYRAVSTVLGERANRAAPTVPPFHEQRDPLATQKTVAVWVAVGGGVLAASLMFGGGILRAGRRRRWRPGGA